MSQSQNYLHQVCLQGIPTTPHSNFERKENYSQRRTHSGLCEAQDGAHINIERIEILIYRHQKHCFLDDSTLAWICLGDSPSIEF